MILLFSVRFWPSCFLYLSAIIPVIWVLELDLLQHRLDERDQLNRLASSKMIVLTQASFGKVCNGPMGKNCAQKRGSYEFLMAN